ncbi:hypothetical protein P3T76_003065 [Phytophthora citrophthora]|uniref:Uncharacterized protein n=1 Tax=Phytophthora citrophthora TaxID=4793 RepID=A0AAD9GWL6_9STRA|nr:hypothetical protein P3T76_003065 [Phytophthora citrophthora]
MNELPVPVLVNVLSFLQDDLAARVLSRKSGTTKRRHGATIRALAAVSKPWASAIEDVEGHFSDSILVFSFQKLSDNAIAVDDEEQSVSIVIDCGNEVSVRDSPSWGVLKLLTRLVVAFWCSSNDHPPGRSPEEEEVEQKLILSKRKEIQKQNKPQHVENELKRLLVKAENWSTPGLVELWLNDLLDITIHGIDGQSYNVLPYWQTIFWNCQDIVCLNLSGMPMESDHLPAILNAAGENCAHLRELVMPQQTHLMHRRRSIQAALEAFHDALKSLATRSGKEKGLKKLVLPWLFPIENVDATTAIIGEHCSNLEYIEGLRLAAFTRRRRLTSVEMRRSSLESWEAFCKGCSHLVELNWCGLPCSEEMFDVFASYPKLTLKSLVLPGNSAQWRRDYVLQERHHVEPLSPSNRFAPVLRGCPNLTSLEVLLSDMQGESELLDDQFLRQVVSSCPLLERLALVEASVPHGFGPSNAFTNEGLKTLGDLVHLQTIEISGATFSEKTLVSLAGRPRPSDRPRTSIGVTISARGWTVINVAESFHETITNLLGILLSLEVYEYPAFVIRVRIETHHSSPLVEWATSFTTEWTKLKRKLAPNIKFHYDYLRAEVTIIKN